MPLVTEEIEEVTQPIINEIDNTSLTHGSNNGFYIIILALIFLYVFRQIVFSFLKFTLIAGISFLLLYSIIR